MNDCPVQNIFHQSSAGCRFEEDEHGNKVHVFLSTNVSILPDGIPVVHKLRLKNKLNVSFPDPNSLRARVTTTGCGSDSFFIGIESFLTVDNFKSTLHKLLTLYFEERVGEDHLVMHPKNFMDLYVNQKY